MNKMTPERAKKAIETAVSVVSKATGKGLARPLFKGFKVMENITADLRKAVECFAQGDLEESFNLAIQAKGGLFATLRGYARGAVRFFAPQIEELADELDEDIFARLEVLRKNFEVSLLYLESEYGLEGIEKVSAEYWILLDAIQNAEREQEAREENRRRRAEEEKLSTKRKLALERKKKEEEQARKSRETQKRLDAEKRQAEVSELTSLLDSVL